MKILFAFDFSMPMYNYNYIFPIGLLSLATILKEKDYDVEIVDLNYLFLDKIINYDTDPMKNLETVAGYITGKNPDIVGFTTTCSSFHNILLLCRLIKNINNKIKTILGGPQSAYMPEKILENYDWIDLICPGEGEAKILDIVKGLEDNDLSSVHGIVYRNNGRISRNAESDLIKDLDTLPLLNYNLIPYPDRWEIAMEITRGCPYNCIFCSTADFWKHKFRRKSIERICKEILSVKNYSSKKQTHIIFTDDNFTTDYNFTMNLCRELQTLNIKWNCDARLDTLDEKLIKEMALAGCKFILIGIESASPAIQKYINKHLNLEKLMYVVELMQENNIEPVPSFIYGFPSETEEDLNMTLNTIYSLFKQKAYRTILHSLCVLTGTQLFEDQKDNLILKDFYSDIADTENFELSRDMISGNKDLFSHFYIFKDSIASRYILLDKFVNFILKLHRFFPETITSLAGLFDDNILSFYKDFLITVPEFTDFFKNRNNFKLIKEQSAIVKHLIDFLTLYINKKSFNDFSYGMISHRFCNEKEELAKGVKSE